MAFPFIACNAASILVFLFLGNFDTIKQTPLEAKPVRDCSAPTVVEGETGVLSFFLRRDINLVDDNVFITMARTKDPADYILICERNSPMTCRTTYPIYETTEGILDHEVTLRIPNVTKSFEDNYVLQMYVNDNPKPPVTCRLTVQAKSSRPCNAPMVLEGETGVITYFIRKNISWTSLTVTSNGAKQRELLSCQRKETSRPVQCDVKDSRYKYNLVEKNELMLRIPEASPDLTGYYILKVKASNAELQPEYCYFEVEGAREKPDAKTQNNESGNTFILIIILLIVIIVFLACACAGKMVSRRQIRSWWKSCKTKTRRTRRADFSGETSQHLLGTENTENGENERNRFTQFFAWFCIPKENDEDVKRKRWYRGKITREDEEKLLQFKRNSSGSFLVKVCDTKPGSYILTVLHEGQMKNLKLVHTRKGFKCHKTGKRFRSLDHAVDFYRENEIRVMNTVWTKLTKPLEMEPEEEWYFGQLGAKRVEKILKMERNGPGSYLMTLSNNDDDGYDLSVYDGGRVVHFEIIPEDDGYRMLETDRVFPTLPKLVEYYTDHEIIVDTSKKYGKLGQPCSKDYDDILTAEELTPETESKFLNSKKARPGCYLLYKDNADSTIYILTVCFDHALRRFRIALEKGMFKFVPTGRLFHTLYELFDYYKEHEIRTEVETWGKLSKAFRKEPDENWYFGQLRRELEDKALLSGKSHPGAYLIRDGLTDPNNYVLTTCFGGELERHVIIWDGNGWNILNTKQSFKSLSALVEHYTNNDIPPVDTAGSRRLTRPCSKDPPATWYAESLTRHEEELYLQSKRTRPGSFIITRERDMQSMFTLAVFFDGKLKKFTVMQKGNGVVFGAHMFFYTWYELVDYYREHDIQMAGRTFGKLGRPLRMEPKEDWYFENATPEIETAVFRTGKEGSFLIRDGMTESDEYVLAVCFHGKIKQFTIMPEEDGFKLGDSVFDTLAELVEHYKKNNIVFAGTTFGKLEQPLPKSKRNRRN